jgi:hypothetical protein
VVQREAADDHQHEALGDLLDGTEHVARDAAELAERQPARAAAAAAAATASGPTHQPAASRVMPIPAAAPATAGPGRRERA